MHRPMLLACLLALGCGSSPTPSPEGSSARGSGDGTTSGMTSAASPPPPPPTPPATHAVRELDVTMAGRAIGDITFERTPLPDGGFTVATRTHLRMELTGRVTQESRSEETQEIGPGCAPRGGSHISHEHDVDERVIQTLEGGQLHVKVEKVAHREDRNVPLPADWSTDVCMFQALRAQALAGAALPLKRGYSDFDSDDMAFTPHSFTITARSEFGLGADKGKISGWATEQVDEKKGLHARIVVDDEGMPLRVELGSLLATLKGSAAGDAGAPAPPLSSYLTVEGNFAENAETLRVDLFVKDDARDLPDAIATSPYQKVTRDGDRYDLTLVPRRGGEGQAALELPLRDVPADVARFLRPTALSQSDDATIVERAKKIVGSERDSRRAAEAIVHWVHDKLGKRDGVRGAATAVEALASMHGDCTEHAALTVALLRAAGIPARVTSGIVLLRGRTRAEAGYHAWTELWLGEWLAMDAALGPTRVGPSYIWLGYNEPGESQGAGAMSRLIGRTKIVLPR